MQIASKTPAVASSVLVLFIKVYPTQASLETEKFVFVALVKMR